MINLAICLITALIISLAIIPKAVFWAENSGLVLISSKNSDQCVHLEKNIFAIRIGRFGMYSYYNTKTLEWHYNYQCCLTTYQDAINHFSILKNQKITKLKHHE